MLLRLSIVVLLSACQVTMNGVTLTNDQLKKTKRIVVVSVAANTVTFYQQLPRVIQNAKDVSSWQLDRYYADRFADAISKTLGIAAVAYQGELTSGLGKVYAPDAFLRADRFNWAAIKDPVKAIADETGADLVVLLLKDEFQDPTARFQFLVSGLGVSGNRFSCVAFAHLTLVALDPAGTAPVAGANVYLTGSDGRPAKSVLQAPVEACADNHEPLPPAIEQKLRETYVRLLSDQVVRQTSSRLVQQ
ncbi:hypothetical protein [Herbaspirillum sp. alder98]|uniref:hypothetical protein n=1 Tax=Herbaspirillum sp. alder98 TaxID=2913096 RepID=UPI001CD88549|nr:hypothetical protein [Herbaspirillum sp. alder98]MCA1325405.1 hypothetical protein [Herbaspirillum sp. alder98]